MRPNTSVKRNARQRLWRTIRSARLAWTDG
jgi:hypothetical protein